MARLREDERFKAVGPDSIVLPFPTPANTQIGLKSEGENEGEIWFDWAFVDFWKSNYCKPRLNHLSLEAEIWQRHRAKRVRHRSQLTVVLFKYVRSYMPVAESRFDSFEGQSAESAMLVASLRDVIRNQAQEIESLERRVKELSTDVSDVRQPILMYFAVRC